MRLLLDTQLLLWSAGFFERFSRDARDLLEAPESQLLFSAASLWEISIKHALGRADFRVDPFLLRRGLVDGGYEELPVTSAHALATVGLPALHRDPFDRVLIAQATVEGALLLTADTIIARYPGPIRLV